MAEEIMQKRKQRTYVESSPWLAKQQARRVLRAVLSKTTYFALPVNWKSISKSTLNGPLRPVSRGEKATIVQHKKVQVPLYLPQDIGSTINKYTRGGEGIRKNSGLAIIMDQDTLAYNRKRLKNNPAFADWFVRALNEVGMRLPTKRARRKKEETGGVSFAEFEDPSFESRGFGMDEDPSFESRGFGMDEDDESEEFGSGLFLPGTGKGTKGGMSLKSFLSKHGMGLDGSGNVVSNEDLAAIRRGFEKK